MDGLVHQSPFLLVVVNTVECVGRAKAYHWGELYSFTGYNVYSRGINTWYVDGLSFTHGTPRTHIWTFAAGLHQANSSDIYIFL